MMEPSLEQIFQDREAGEIVATLQDEFGGLLRPGEQFALEGQMDAERLIVTLELADTEREEVLRVDAGHEVDAFRAESGATLVDARAHAVEFLIGYVHEYLRNERWPRPHHDWKAYTFQGKQVFLRGMVVNEKLEAMADEWLKKAEANLPD